MKKLTALLLALVMVLAMSASAFADDGDAYNGATKTYTSGNEIPLTKTIVFINENGSTVYQPNITYTYAIDVVDPGDATVTDGDTPADTAKVNAGVAGGVTGVNIPFTSDEAATSSKTGVQVTETGNLTVNFADGSGHATFPHAGIYRYMITETSDPTPESVGITRDNTEYDTTRYLDVYIANGGTVDPTTNPKGLKLQGAVIFKTATTGKDGTDEIKATDKNNQKTTGFEPGVPGTDPANPDYTDDKTVDRYTTYDFTVTKEVTGAFADKTNEFPFHVSVANSIAGAAITYNKDDAETFTGATKNDETKYTLSAAAFQIGAEGAGSSLKLKDGDKIKLIGVPSNQAVATPLSVTVKEYNNTADKYTATVAATNGDIALDDGALETTETASLSSAFNVKGNDVEAQTITFTNTMADVSETGVVLRFAPYAIMLGAGVALFIILKVRKNKAVEEA